MHPLNVFRDLTAAGSRLGFFTRQTSEDIPTAPGCYGWFLPLWILRDSLPEFLNTFGSVMTYEPSSRQGSELDAGFVWDRVKMKVRREFDSTTPKMPAFAEPLWDRVYADENAHDALQQILLHASIFTPPLYVGKTANLRQRYNTHVAPSSPGSRNFHARFAECAERFNLALTVSDLLFVCVRTDRKTENTLSEHEDPQEIEDLLEEILKRLCRPGLSKR